MSPNVTQILKYAVSDDEKETKGNTVSVATKS